LKKSLITKLGVVFCLVGIGLFITTISGDEYKTEVIEKVGIKFSYPNNWKKEIKEEKIAFSATSMNPEVVHEIFIVDLVDRGNTIKIRIVCVESDEHVNVNVAAGILATVNEETLEEYTLVALKEDIEVNGRSASQRIETYKINTDNGPLLVGLVATYISRQNGLCSVLLIESPVRKLYEHIIIYEFVLNSLEIVD
jgi:hypothetical protein